ncbi:MAG: GNAT family N-acetyltransferase [Panacagrimonas sp.]
MKLRLIEIGADGAPARCPGNLPPAARDVMEGTANLYAHEGFHPPWVGYLADRDGDVVGACAFQAPPREGRVEIAGEVFPEFAGRGLATEMARQLLQRARAADPEIEVIARTDAADGAAVRLLRKLGFVPDGRCDGADGPRWEWRAPAQAIA